MKVHAYLNLPGNAAEAFELYRSVFGGDLSSHVRFRDMPMEGVDVPEADQDKAMHIALPIGEDDMLMASDALESLGQTLASGNNVYISVHPDTREDADRIFNGLSAGGEVEMPIADQVWGDYYGACTDRFGVQWMVNHSSQHA
ncbi:MAG TPA: VOC family protein [Egibacteraceae bacterium]|nr:VOC family protein [Egibacteraceae bacterium]